MKGSTTKIAITGHIYTVNIIHAKPSLCPVGRLYPVNGRELNKAGHPALNLCRGVNEVPAKRRGG